MDQSQLTQLDRDETERIESLSTRWREGGVYTEDIFRYRDISQALLEDNLILSGHESDRLMVAAPFTPKIFLSVCPDCPQTHSPDRFLPFVEAGLVVPALFADYSYYSPRFIATIIKHPHISSREYNFYRNVRLLSGEGRPLCAHCFSEREKQLQTLARKKRLGPQVREDVHTILGNLWPLLEPDFSLVNDVEEALATRNRHRLVQLVDLSWTIERVRTAIAFNSGVAIDADSLAAIHTALPEIADLAQKQALRDTKDLLVDGLGLLIPDGMRVEKYVEIILRHRASLKAIGNAASKSNIFEYIATLNEEILSAEKTRRHLVLNAAVGLVRSNPAVTAAVLGAGALGLAGSILGCGAALAVGIGAKIARKLAPVKIDNPTADAARRVIHDMIEPGVKQLLRKYYGISMEAVQVWRIRKELAE